MSLHQTEIRKPLLGTGNSKLGTEIATFTLPAVKTCPGRSALCSRACYALKGALRIHLDAGRYDRAYEESLRDDFVATLVEEIKYRRIKVVRVQVAGDYYSAEYVNKWAAVAAACPDTRFFSYTRSWRVPAIRSALNELAKLPNVRVWYSCDKETGIPANVGKRVRIAYMAVDDQDVPARTPDLGFRVKRTTVRKRVGAALTCPTENGATDLTCQRCGLCWDDLAAKDPRRLALPVVG